MLKSLWENVNRRELLTENEMLNDILLTEVTNGAKCLLRLLERQIGADKPGEEYWRDTSKEAKTANLDFNVNLEKAMKMLDGAKRGLGLVGKMDPSPEKVYHSKRIMVSMNKIRGLVQRLVKQGLESHEEEELHTDVDEFVNDDSYNNYMSDRHSIRRAIEDKMSQRQMDKDIDGLGDDTLDFDPSVKTMDGDYGERKTQYGPSDEIEIDPEMDLDGPEPGMFGDDDLKNGYGDDRRVDSTTTPDFEYEDEEDRYELDNADKQQKRFALRRNIEDRMERKRLEREINGDDHEMGDYRRKTMSGDYGSRKSPEDVENEEFNWDAGNPNDDMTVGNDFSQDGGATHIKGFANMTGEFQHQGGKKYGDKFEPGTDDPILSRRYHDDGGEEDIMDMGTEIDSEEDPMEYNYDADDVETDEEIFDMNDEFENEETSNMFKIGQPVSYDDGKQQFSGTISGYKDKKVKIQIDDEFGGGRGWGNIEHVTLKEDVSYQDLALNLVANLGEGETMYRTNTPPGTKELGVTASKDGQGHTLYGDDVGNIMVIKDSDGSVVASYKGSMDDVTNVLTQQGFSVDVEPSSEHEMFKPASVRRSERGERTRRPKVTS